MCVHKHSKAKSLNPQVWMLCNQNQDQRHKEMEQVKSRGLADDHLSIGIFRHSSKIYKHKSQTSMNPTLETIQIPGWSTML